MWGTSVVFPPKLSWGSNNGKNYWQAQSFDSKPVVSRYVQLGMDIHIECWAVLGSELIS